MTITRGGATLPTRNWEQQYKQRTIKMEIRRYNEVKKDEWYEIFVSEIMFNEFRVSLHLDGDPRIVECFDVEMQRPSHRRFVESYIAEMKKRTNIKEVWFGNVFDNHYTFETYKAQKLRFPKKNWLNDIEL